jgi:activating signal cointegrator complex subunit 1
MSPPDKRGGSGTSRVPTHVFRGGSPRKELPASSSSSASSIVRSNNVIAAPPRAQLNSSPSPEGQSRAPSGSGPPLSSNSSGGGGGNGTATPMSRRSSNAPSTRSLAVSAMFSTEAAMKEKDTRISILERKMELMETEFQRELDKLSCNESETASFWQAKHSALNQQFLRTDTELRLLRDEMRAREAETEDLTRGWRDALTAELKSREDEIRGLQAQIRGLKEWVSTSTRADGITSDEVFGSGMANLGNSLQNWVITYFRKVKVDLSKAGETALQELAELVPLYDELAQTARIHLLQSIVSRILVHRIFRAYFVGLSPDQEQQLKETERMMASFGQYALSLLPGTLLEDII